MKADVSESRFTMWRAVFAMAHADRVVTDEERAFMRRYLAEVPFSEEQRQQLRQDMNEAQDVYELFSLIDEEEDRGQFFQFARELCWCDGDYDAQEQEIKDRLKAEHLSRMNLGRLELELHKSRAEMKMKRTADSRALRENAKGVFGLTALIKKIFKGSNRR